MNRGKRRKLKLYEDCRDNDVDDVFSDIMDSFISQITDISFMKGTAKDDVLKILNKKGNSFDNLCDFVYDKMNKDITEKIYKELGGE